MATKLVPVEWRLSAARQFIESLTEAANTAWYAYFGNHTATSNPGNVYDMTLDTTVNAYRNMIMGKRVASSDVTLMIRKVTWTSNTVYAPYDHGDPIMHDKDYYVSVDAGSYSHVFKCLDNNLGTPSTAAPNFADVDSTDAVYQTSDGYRWKYMYSVDSTTVDRFATSSFFPLVANASVVAAAVPGAIDIIRVYDTGEGYRNYLTGTLDSSHVRVGGNNLIYSVSSNTSASPSAGFYTGCMMYISAGTGAGGFSLVTDYFSNSSGKFVQLQSAFAVDPVNGSEWELYPSVSIGSGADQTTNAVARALVNAVGNSVYRVEMLERGRDYTYATAAVVANSAVGVLAAANDDPEYSPPGGHGSDAASELGVTRVGVTVKISNTESNTIPQTNDYAQVGLLRDPVFANVQLTLASGAGTFYVGETIEKYTGIQLVNDGTCVAADVYVSSNSGYWSTKVSIGDQLVITGGNTAHQLLTVNAVTNTTHVQVNSAIAFSCSQLTVQRAFIDPSHAIALSQPAANNLMVDLYGGVWGNTNQIIGVSSGAAANVVSVTRNGVTKGFDTFVQCWKYTGTYLSGTFVQDEVVYQGASVDAANATAVLHSAELEGGLNAVLTTNQIGSFDTSVSLKGANSGAIFTITNKYSPEIKYGTGRVAYVQNMDPVARSNGQAEAFKLILEF